MNIKFNEIGVIDFIEEEYNKYIRRKSNIVNKLNDNEIELFKNRLNKEISIREIYSFYKDRFYEDIKIIEAKDKKYMKMNGKFFKCQNIYIFEPDNFFNEYAYTIRFPEREGYIKYNDNLIFYTYNDHKFYIESKNHEFINNEVVVELVKCKDYRVVTELYFEKYKEKFMEFKHFGFPIIDTFEKYKLFSLEQYIQSNYNGFSKFYENINYTELVKNKIILKHEFEKIKFHDKINLNIDKYIKNPKTKGTIIDYAIKKIVDPNSCCPLSYLRTCKEYDSFSEELKRLNDDELYNKLLSMDFKEKVKKINNFKNLKVGKLSYNHSLEIYGIPDLHNNTNLFDIKTSIKNVVKVKNYLQLLYYSLLLPKIKKIYIYDPLEGFLYLMDISKIDMSKLKDTTKKNLKYRVKY
tara:strand:+ start:54 stop:1277 length:1224 start_codon:yes stop_codon:yes gene_type:complete